MKNIGIIIVTFNPNVKDFADNLNNINKLNVPILIIDNGSESKIREQIISVKNKYQNIALKFLNKNMGIGYAQNYGIDYFKSDNNIDFCFFLDQDSYITIKDFNQLLKEYNLLQKQDSKIVAIGPAQFYDNLNGKKIALTNTLISSGSLVPMTSFDRVGKYKAEYFIDYIDYEWNWRANSNGYHVYKTKNVSMTHETQGVERLGGHTVDPIFRLYYIFRNSTYIILYENVSLNIKLKLLIRNFGKLLFQIRLKENKRRLKTSIKGIKDGINKELNYEK